MMMNERKFTEALNNLMQHLFEREQELRQLDEPEDYMPHPAVAKIMNQMALAEFCDDTRDLVEKVVEHSGMDPREYVQLSGQIAKEFHEKQKRHSEWYRKQEYDV
jgi:hypothetical protein